MRLDDMDTSGVDVEDQRGLGSGGGGFPLLALLPFTRGLGCGGLVLLIGLAFFMGINPLQLLGIGQNGPVHQVQQAPGAPAQGKGCEENAASKFSCQVLASANATWAKAFPAGQYKEPKIVFYTRQGQSGCGAAQSAMGPFYCPADQGIYLDTDFYAELSQRFGAAGDFAQAYVVAHEVGHHIQYLTGIADQVRSYQERASEADGNKLQVAMELQADCYAGVWAARNKDRLEPGDIEEGLRAAHQIGDDVLQQQAQGRVVPESFTHGSAKDRMAWLKRGLETGDPDKCDPFTTVRLQK
ncbi:MAG: neutral zinc metallopeptidase [Chakrabartia sp.]